MSSNSLMDVSIKIKILGIVVAMLVLMGITVGYGLIKSSEIGGNLTDIAHEDIHLIQSLNDLGNSKLRPPIRCRGERWRWCRPGS